MQNRKSGYSAVIRSRTNLSFVLASTGVALLGFVLLVLGNQTFTLGWWEFIRPVVRDLGSLLIASVAVGVLWEVIGKRSFRQELFAQAQISEDLQRAGIEGCFESFRRFDDWSEMFRNSTSVDIYVAYARTWRESCREDLETFVKRKKAYLRVILPDPTNELVVAELGRRYGYTPEEMQQHIKEAIQFFDALRKAAPRGAKVEIWLCPTAPQFTFYRFDQHVLVAFYSHRAGKVAVPLLILAKEGTLFRFISDEVSGIIKLPGAKSV